MLYAVAHPRALIGLVLGYLAGVLVHGVAAAYAARWAGDAMPMAYGRGKPVLRRHLDPFGAVAAAIGGVGWAVPALTPGRRVFRRNRLVLASLAGPAANLVLGAIGLVVFVAAGAPKVVLGGVHVDAVVHGDYTGVPLGQLTALGFAIENLAMGFLSLFPLPPLEGATVMFAYAPRSIGWQQAEFRLVEQNWGLGILLLLLLIPFTSHGPLIIYIIDAIVHGILSAVV